MVNHTCSICSTQFQSYDKVRKYCSKKCYGVYVKSVPRIVRSPSWVPAFKNKKRPEHGQKVREKLTGVKFTEQRKKNIQKGKGCEELTLEQKDKIMSVWKLGYISSMKLICEYCSVSRSQYASYYKFQNENQTLIESMRTLSSYVEHTQRILLYHYDEFKKFCEDNTLEAIAKKFSLTEGKVEYLCKKLGFLYQKKDRIQNLCATKIEKIISNILDTNNISYKFQFRTPHGKYIFDFLIQPNLIIEVHGDYWHANPKVFSGTYLTYKQTQNLIRDREKAQWCDSNNFKLLLVWEYDIYNNLSAVENYILKTIQLMETK